jgi:hypothetical protein
MFVALIASVITFGLGACAAPAEASDTARPPAGYSVAYEKAHAAKGVQAIKGYVGNGKAYNPNAKLLTGPYYFYAGARQRLAAGESANSLAVNLNVYLAYLDTANDAHTLMQLAVQSHDSQQAVEFGVTHDPAVCGAGNSPCLFGGYRKNGVWGGYSTGFVDYAANTTHTLGTTLVANPQKRFQVTYSGGNWWLAYDLAWIGYFPGTLWTNAPNSVTFDKGGLFQSWTEVATKVTGDATPCTDAGNGELGNSVAGTSARVGTNALGGTLPGAIANNFTGFSYGLGIYTHNTVSAQTTRVGGPGYNAAGTAVGTIGSC